MNNVAICGVDDFRNEIAAAAESIPMLSAEDLMMVHRKIFSEIKTREDILDFEAEIKAMETSFDECPYPLFHTFADGMYTREIHFNKGDLIVGAIHKNDYFVNVLKGRIWVVSEFGPKEIIAPASFTAKAGVKHIGFTLEDTVWSDTHKVNSTTVEEAEKEIFADSYDELDRHNGIIYSDMCADIGLSEEEVKAMSDIEHDIIEQPEDHIEFHESAIHGMGTYATKDISAGERVATARVGTNRTPAGKYVNHSDTPNTIGMVHENEGYYEAVMNIKKGDEITANYRDIRVQAKLLDRGESCQDG